ncbi:MAG: class I SAM-dependent methyltransferase, partial [Candidatus Acidiferrum sp.]
MTDSVRTSWPLTWIGRWHHALVFRRRTQVLADLLARQIPQRASVLDIGCGDGTIAGLIASYRSDISIQGVECLVRPDCKIPCLAYDGITLPFPDAAFDVCMFVDVLHHTQNIAALLSESRRVSRSYILIKDHIDKNILDNAALRLMDWVGNRPHGVWLTY